MISVGDIFVALRANSSGLRNDLDDAKKETTSWAKNLGGTVSKFVGGAVIAGAAAAGAAVVGIGKAAFDTAGQFSTAQKLMQSQLGATDERAAELGQTVKNIFANNFGNDIADVAESVSTVERAYSRLGESARGATQKATESAIALRDAFGVEVGESAQAAAELMDKFGLSSAQAFDFIATGMQRGLDSSDDFLDSITEYSTQFSNGGADAGQFFSILETGLQSGMLGTDKAADAFKEFRVRIGDGSATTAAGLEMLGINVEAFTNKLADGSMSTADAFQIILDSLRGIEDPTLRMQAGVALIGTQFEDLGDSAVAALSLTTTGIDDMSGAIDSLNTQYNTLPTFFEGLKRRALVAITPMGDALLNVANSALPAIEQAFKNAEIALKGFIDNSAFEWTPEFKQIKLGDLFEFVQADGLGLKSIRISDWFDFTVGTDLTKLSLGDFFDFIKDNGLTKINIGDFFSFTSWEGITQLTLGDLFSFVNDTGGTEVNLADYISFVYNATTGESTIDLSQIIAGLVGAGGKAEVEITPVVNKDGIEKIGMSDIFSFITAQGDGSFDIAGIFTWDPTSIGSVSLKEIFPFLGDDLKFKLSDTLTIGTDFPVFAIGDFLPFLGEGGTFDLAKIFVAGEGGAALSDFSKQMGQALTDIGDDWLVKPIANIEWPSLPDIALWLTGAVWPPLPAIATWLAGVTWPKLPDITTWAAGMTWPSLPDLVTWVAGLTWPDLPDIVAWVSALTWPSLPDIAAWISALKWPELPSLSAWVSSLKWPSLPSLSSWLAGFKWPSLPSFGGGGGSGTSSSGSIGPNGGAVQDGDNTGGGVVVSAVGTKGTTSAGGKVVNVNFYNTVVNNNTDIEALAYQVGRRIVYAT